MTITTLTPADLAGSDCRDLLMKLLSPRATVVVAWDVNQRLPVRLLAAALDATVATGGFLRFEGLSPVARLALQVVDPERRLAVEDPARSTSVVGERPFQVTLHPDGGVHLLLLKGIGQHPHMTESIAHDWVRGLDASMIEVDLRHIEHLNSLLVAWLLQLNQGAGPGRCRLIQVGRQAVAQLTQLRLNHLLTIS